MTKDGLPVFRGVVVALYHVECGTEGCDEMEETTREDKTIFFKDSGWRVRAGKWRCPECVADIDSMENRCGIKRGSGKIDKIPRGKRGSLTRFAKADHLPYYALR